MTAYSVWTSSEGVKRQELALPICCRLGAHVSDSFTCLSCGSEWSLGVAASGVFSSSYAPLAPAPNEKEEVQGTSREHG